MRISTIALLVLVTGAATARAQTEAELTAGIQAADSAALWRRPAKPLQPTPDRFVLNEWTMDTWRETKLEEALRAHSDGEFVRVYPAEGDSYAILVRTPNRKGEVAQRVLTLGRTAHTLLLQKALFKKLGYAFPAATSLPHFKVRFATAADKDAFKAALETRTSAGASRWVEAETDLALDLRDIVLSDQSLIGEPMAETIVPRVLADCPENVNVYGWVPGTPEQGGYRVQYPEIELYQPSEPELARVLYRLAKMTRADWEFVARQAQLPLPVEKVVVEKLVSRAEAVLDYFEIPHQEVEFDERPFQSPDLLNGVLVEKDWPGYATRFSERVDPNTGAGGDLGDFGGRFRAFTRSKVFSLLLGVAVKKFNDLPFMHTRGYDEALAKHEARELAKQLELYQQTGEVQKTPFGAWGYGFAAGQLILSRDVIAGSYLGTNHLLQIIDQVGFRLNAGGQLTMEGGPHYVEAEMGGDVAFSRVYAHVKPIKSLTEARTEGFRNATLPFLIRKNASSLSMESLKNALKPGESLIITDNLVLNADLRAAAILYGFGELALTGQGSEVMLNRFHLYRRDDGTMQVHQDKAETRLLAFAASAGVRFKMPKFLEWLVAPENRAKKTRIPLYTYRWSNHAGQTATKFYNVPLSPQSLPWLKTTLASNRLEVLEEHVKPVVIHNEFRDKTNEHRFLFWSNRKLKSAMDLTVEAAGAPKRTFVRDFFARTSGRNVEKPGTDAVSFLFNALTGARGLNVAATSINPGYTIFGRAKNDLVEFEAERMPDGSLAHPYAKVTQSYNGWSLNPKKFRKILAQLSAKAGKELTAPAELSAGEDVLLYNVSLNTQLSERAMIRLASVTRNDVVRAVAKADIPDDELRAAASEDSYDGTAERIYRLIENFRQDGSPKHLLKALSAASASLDSESWLQLLGGEDGVHQYVRIEGFAPGARDGDAPVQAVKSVEIQGRPQRAGPLSVTRDEVGMTEGEFLSQWITGRAL